MFIKVVYYNDWLLSLYNYRKVQGAVASWLVPLSPDRVVWVRALAYRTLWVVFLAKTFDSHSASLRPGVEMGTSQLNAGSNPAVD